MTEPLEPIGPRDPTIREYAAELGTVTLNCAHLERTLRDYLRHSNHLATSFNPPRIPHLIVVVKLEKMTLAPLIDAFGRHGGSQQIVDDLHAVRKERNKVIHHASRFIGDDFKINWAALEDERRYLRTVLSQVRAIHKIVKRFQRNVLLDMVQAIEDVRGPNDPDAQRFRHNIGIISDMIERD